MKIEINSDANVITVEGLKFSVYVLEELLNNPPSNGEGGYGVKAILENGEQLGNVCAHSPLTRSNPNAVELDRMESDLSQQLSELLLPQEDK